MMELLPEIYQITRSVSATATVLGVDESKVRSALKSPRIRRAIDRVAIDTRQNLQASVELVARVLLARLMQTLLELLQHTNPRVRLQAAELTLQYLAQLQQPATSNLPPEVLELLR